MVKKFFKQLVVITCIMMTLVSLRSEDVLAAVSVTELQVLDSLGNVRKTFSDT